MDGVDLHSQVVLFGVDVVLVETKRSFLTVKICRRAHFLFAEFMRNFCRHGAHKAFENVVWKKILIRKVELEVENAHVLSALLANAVKFPGDTGWHVGQLLTYFERWRCR